MVSRLEGFDKYATTIQKANTILNAWFLDNPDKDIYEFSVTLNTLFEYEDLNADMMIASMDRYCTSFPWLVSYKMCMDLNKNDRYHGHVWLALSENVPYKEIQFRWSILHKTTPWVTPVTDRPGLFKYFDGHRVSKNLKNDVFNMKEFRGSYYHRLITK